MSTTAMTVQDVAEYLDVDAKTVYRMVNRGDLPGFKVGGVGGSGGKTWTTGSRSRRKPPPGAMNLLTRDMIHAVHSGNPFEQSGTLIARMDQLARNEELQDKLAAVPEWDLVIVDEAHRMSGHLFGNEIKLTRRYKLGPTLGAHCRNFLLMTATPHNGKEEDFQIFLALLDGDRFEGKFRDGVHTAAPSDLMRRLVKEDLFRFDRKPLFPERCSYTVQYEFSPEEAHLYSEVTDYVREEMNRAERFVDTGEGQRRVNVGFALMILQRRLASSPESIYRSLTRRRERLESRLREARLLLRGRTAPLEIRDSVLDGIDEDVFIEVKGRQAGASTVTLTKNEILAALNSAERFRLAIVEVDGDEVKPPIYVQGFDFGQPGFAQTSANFDLTSLLRCGGSARVTPARGCCDDGRR